MKKFKLIKIYPGVEKLSLGTEITNKKLENPCGFYTKSGVLALVDNPQNYPELWQEVIEKDYRVLTVNPTGYHKAIPNKKEVFTWETCNKDFNYWSIHSVERLSDGKIFTLGDDVSITEEGITKGWDRNPVHKISSFFLNDNETLGIVCTSDVPVVGDPCQEGYRSGTFTINDIEKRVVLFTTEDGVEIFNGDIFFWIDRKSFKLGNLTTLFTNPVNTLYFSTKEKAEEYILMNKPCLSLNEIFNMVQDDRSNESFSHSRLGEMLKELAKTKI